MLSYHKGTIIVKSFLRAHAPAGDESQNYKKRLLLKYLRHTTEFGERDCTILAVMEKSRFPGWLKEREDREKSISDF